MPSCWEIAYILFDLSFDSMINTIFDVCCFDNVSPQFDCLMMMMNCYCGMVDRRKAFSLISSRDHCQRSSPSRISDTSGKFYFDILIMTMLANGFNSESHLLKNNISCLKIPFTCWSLLFRLSQIACMVTTVHVTCTQLTLHLRENASTVLIENTFEIYLLPPHTDHYALRK